MLLKLGSFVLIALTSYLGVASLLILSDRPQPRTDSNNPPITFDALLTSDYANIPALHPHTARDGATLRYRTYDSKTDTDKVLILLHGSGWHSMQFHPLASFISETGLAHGTSSRPICVDTVSSLNDAATWTTSDSWKMTWPI